MTMKKNSDKRSDNIILFPKLPNILELGEKKNTNTNTDREKKTVITNSESEINKNEKKNNLYDRLEKNIQNKFNFDFRNKFYLNKIKGIYESPGKDKNEKQVFDLDNNIFNLPKLLKYKDEPLIKKNSKLFFSLLHYTKYMQMKRIKNRIAGIKDKDVFDYYNKNS